MTAGKIKTNNNISNFFLFIILILLFFLFFSTKCPVCSSKVRTVNVLPTMTLNELIQQLCDGEGDLRLKSPSLTSASKLLYMQKPPALESATRSNLDKPLKSLVMDGEEIAVTDPVLQHAHLSLAVRFKQIN